MEERRECAEEGRRGGLNRSAVGVRQSSAAGRLEDAPGGSVAQVADGMIAVV